MATTITIVSASQSPLPRKIKYLDRIKNDDLIIPLDLTLNISNFDSLLLLLPTAAPAMTRADYTDEEVTEYFNYMGMLAEEVNMLKFILLERILSVINGGR